MLTTACVTISLKCQVVNHILILMFWFEELRVKFNDFTEAMGFPHSSVGKESTCNAGDPSSIPGLGRFPGEGIGYPLQYWASLVAQLAKNPPAMWETLGSIPGLGRSPGEEKGYSLQYSGLENSMDCILYGVQKSWTWLSLSLCKLQFWMGEALALCQAPKV